LCVRRALTELTDALEVEEAHQHSCGPAHLPRATAPRQYEGVLLQNLIEHAIVWLLQEVPVDRDHSPLEK
jgi:hypothetical protein